MQTYSDSELVALMKGDKPAMDASFAELYARHHKRVYSYCLRILESSEEASDAFQEVFVRFFKAITKGQDMPNCEAFLLRTARNYCLNQIRNKKHNDQSAIESLQSYELSPDADQSELLELVESAMNQIDPKYKEALVLRFQQGMSYDEIAEVTSESANTIRTRVWRAKEQLRSKLMPYINEFRNT